MSTPEVKRNPVEELAEEFLERYRRGERPSLSEYVRRHPELAAEIRDVFPALVMMEEAGPKSAEARATRVLGSAMRFCERLGDYRILREVGRGGMGIVYEAEQESLGRHVALKVLPSQASTSPIHLQRFRREARSAARLHHTNIVPVFDVGEFQGTHFYAMQFIQGQGLDEVLDELRRLRGVSSARATDMPGIHTGSGDPNLTSGLAQGLLTDQFVPSDPEITVVNGQEPGARGQEPANKGEETASAGQPPVPLTTHCSPPTTPPSSAGQRSDLSTQSDRAYYRSVARVGLQVAEALAYAHAQKVLHRDIKPANLLLDLQGTIWVTDFGLAKEEGDDLTHTGDLVGTLRYMAPERFNGLSDVRSDVYSVGLTLYELLTLRPAFEEMDRGRLIKRITHEEPASPRKRDPHAPRDLETIILKAIAKEPRLRYQSADEMCEDLRRFLGDRPIRARRSAAWEHAWRWCRRNPLVACLLAAVVFLLTAVAGVSLLSAVQLNQALDQTRDAEREAEQDRDRAVKAEEQGRLELGKSLLAQGRANQRSGLAGQRFDSLDLLGRAATILRAHPQGREYLPEIRDQVIAALGLSDVRILGQPRSMGAGWCAGCDARLERYAGLNLYGTRDLVVRRIEDDGELFRFPPPENTFFWYVDVCFSPDGRYLAAGYRGPEVPNSHSLVRVWRLGNKEPIFSQATRETAWAFQPGGRLLFCPLADQGGGLAIWDLEARREVKRLPVDQTPAVICPANDGRRVAANFGAPHQVVKVLDLETGRESASRSFPVDTGTLCWSADGKLLAIGTMGRVYVWDVPRGEILSVLHGHTDWVVRCAFAHGSHLLATTSWDRTTRLWDAASGEALVSVSGGIIGPFAPDDRRLVFQDRDKIGIWEVAHARQCSTLHPGMIGNRTETGSAAGNVEAADFSPDDRLLAAACGDGVRLYDTSTNLELAHLPTGPSFSVLFHPDGRSLITSAGTGLHRWPIRFGANVAADLKSAGKGTQAWQVGPPQHLANPAAMSKAAWLPGYSSLAAIDRHKSRVLLVDVTGKKRPQPLLGKDPRMTTIAVSSDGHWLAAGGYRERHGIQIWNLPARKLEHLLPYGDGKGDQAAFVAFSPDGKWLVSYTESDEAGGYYFWRTGTWERGPVIRSPGTARQPPLFSHDGRLLAVGLSPHQILLADAATGRAIAHLSTLQPVSATPLAFSADDTRLACATNQRTIMLWDLRGVRAELAKLDLDWAAPSYPPVAPPQSAPVRLRVDTADLGMTAKQKRSYWQTQVAVNSVRLAFNPFDFQAALRRGTAYVFLEQPAEGLHDYAHALALIPPSKVEGQAAGTCWDIALRLNNWAWDFARKPGQTGNPHKALFLARNAVELAPGEWLYRNTLGVVCYRVGKHQEACQHLERSLRDSQGDSDAFDLFFLAMCHHRLGDPGRGRECYDRAVRWAQEKQSQLPRRWNEELKGFRAEADAILGLAKP
jgi:serine/threonine protein kinase/WD40 repeat protein